MPRLPSLRLPRSFALLPPLLAALLAPAVHAQGDPLKSAACGAALQQLQAARETAAPAGQVEALRHAAARSCLGAGDPPARPGRMTQAPVAVPPPIIAPPAAPRSTLPGPPAPLPPPVAVTRPPLVTSCDAGGCWTSNGERLNRVGPDLVGPRGACAVHSGVAFCP